MLLILLFSVSVPSILSFIPLSTFFLTFLLLIGLFFFIRAATKDRTEKVQLVSEEDETVLMPQLKEYFSSRSYQVIALDRSQNQVTFQGFVRPSGFLAVFLTILSFSGLICLSLVLSILFPSLSQFFPVIVVLSPISGIFYWKKAGRIEKVLLKMEANHDEQHPLSRITVTAHRDELTELRKALKLETSR